MLNTNEQLQGQTIPIDVAAPYLEFSRVRAASANGKCVAAGVAIATAWTAGSSRTSSKELVVDTVEYEVAPAGTTDWAATPAALDTAALADGLYDLRAIATDKAGNSASSTRITDIRVDNTAPETLSNFPADPQSADVTVTLTPTPLAGRSADDEEAPCEVTRNGQPASRARPDGHLP